MTNLIEKIHALNINKIDESIYKKRLVGCIVISKDNKIVLQQRGEDCQTHPGFLAEFGGHIEAGEQPIQALVRELNEELGATVKASDVISLGAITEAITHHSELIYVYFWHDKQGTITGCYEGECKYYNNIREILKHPKIMDSVLWLLNECYRKNLMP